MGPPLKTPTLQKMEILLPMLLLFSLLLNSDMPKTRPVCALKGILVDFLATTFHQNSKVNIARFCSHVRLFYTFLDFLVFSEMEEGTEFSEAERNQKFIDGNRSLLAFECLRGIYSQVASSDSDGKGFIR